MGKTGNVISFCGYENKLFSPDFSTSDWELVKKKGFALGNEACMLSNAERIISSRKCFFDKILSKFWLFFKSNFGSFGSNLKTTSGYIKF